jgi:hypothetical protein
MTRGARLEPVGVASIVQGSWPSLLHELWP